MDRDAMRDTVYQDHCEIISRHLQVKEAVTNEPDLHKVVTICEEALLGLVQHMGKEEALMIALGFHADKRKRHFDHHQMIRSYLSHELERLKNGDTDGRKAVELADEWMLTHSSLFDNEFTQFLLTTDSQTKTMAAGAAR
jgi:hemerythrin